MGVHSANETIHLTKSITITSEKGRGKIVQDTACDVEFTFVVKTPGITVTLSNLNFEGISILDVQFEAKIIIHETSVVGGRNHVIRVKNAIPFQLFLSQSAFTNTGKIYSETWSRINIKDRFSTISIENSTFNNIKGIHFSDAREVKLKNCSFIHTRNDQPLGFVFVSHTNIVEISSSRFLNYTGPRYGFLNLFKVMNAHVKYSSFEDGQAGKQAGCVYMYLVTNSTVEHSKFIRCRSGQNAGAIRVNDNKGNCKIAHSTFIGNQAEKSGGAVYLGSIKYGQQKCNLSSSTLIENCSFFNNVAGSSGSSINSDVKLNLQNITIAAADNTSVTHLQLKGELVTLGNIEIRTENLGHIQSSIARHGIDISSSDVQINGKVSYICPRHFNVLSNDDSYSTFMRKLSRFEMIYILFKTRCETCPPDHYTLKTGRLDVRPYKPWDAYRDGFMTAYTAKEKWHQTMSTEECLVCPSGATCNGNIIPLDNFWGYRTVFNTVAFVQCPDGYCCSSQNHPMHGLQYVPKGKDG